MSLLNQYLSNKLLMQKLSSALEDVIPYLIKSSGVGLKMKTGLRPSIKSVKPTIKPVNPSAKVSNSSLSTISHPPVGRNEFVPYYKIRWDRNFRLLVADMVESMRNPLRWGVSAYIKNPVTISALGGGGLGWYYGLKQKNDTLDLLEKYKDAPLNYNTGSPYTETYNPLYDLKFRELYMQGFNLGYSRGNNFARRSQL